MKVIGFGDNVVNKFKHNSEIEIVEVLASQLSL